MKRQQPKTYGFGYDPADSLQQFVLLFDSDGSTRLEEWFDGDKGGVRRAPDLKATISSYIWAVIAAPVAEEFNRRLRREGHKPAQWETNGTSLAPYFGKELALLFWAVEGADPADLGAMIANWQGLAPEERWWLYSTINATSQSADHRQDRGWRKAIKIAFAENSGGPSLLGISSTSAQCYGAPAVRRAARAGGSL